MPLSQVAVTLPRGMKTRFKCMGARKWQGGQLIEWDTFGSTDGPATMLGFVCAARPKRYDRARVFPFTLTINVRFLLIRGRKGQIEDEKERERLSRTEKRKKKNKVTSCVNFYSNSFKGNIKLYHNIQPPWNNLYANKALHMVWAVCSSAGKIVYVVSEFRGSQMFFNL